MGEPQTWRELLKVLTNDLQEREYLAERLGVSAVTLGRWVARKTQPRMDNLRLLPEALPGHRKQMHELLEREYPQLFANDADQKYESLEIPASLYQNIMTIYTTMPLNLRPWAIYEHILQQLCAHLDPTMQGTSAIIVQCVPPDEQEKSVRSLRTIMGRGTLPQLPEREDQTMFLGAESQAGYAIITGRTTTVQDFSHEQLFPPFFKSTIERSAVSCPIISAGRVAGCIMVSSTQPNDFTPARVQLIQMYANLLSLAFNPSDFYSFDQIRLNIMPPYWIQAPYLKLLQQRVAQLLMDALRKQQPLTRSEAEVIIWKELERQLLEVSLHSFQKEENESEPHTLER